MGSYFPTYVSHLLGFDMDDLVKFDIKYFFLEEGVKGKSGCVANWVVLPIVLLHSR